MSDEPEEDLDIVAEIQRHRQALRQMPVAPTTIDRKPPPREISFLIEETTPRELLARAEAERQRLIAALKQGKHPKFCRLHLQKGIYFQEFQVPIRKSGEAEISPRERLRRCVAYFNDYSPEELLIFELEAIIQDGVPHMVKVELREEAPLVVNPHLGTSRLKELADPDWTKLKANLESNNSPLR
jgi:hypothetical protein